MTLTLTDLTNWRALEKDTATMNVPPGGRDQFLKDLPVYLKQVQAEAGEHPAVWPADCEALAAREVLEDIFRIRRDKLARAAALCPDDATMPWPKQLLPFESCCWFGLTEYYRMIDKEYAMLAKTGSWSGKWGSLK